MLGRLTTDEKRYLGKMKKTCKNCWQKGHNIRSCVNETKYRPPKKVRPRGRPRKAEALTTVIYSVNVRARRGGGWIADETMTENIGFLPGYVPDAGQQNPDVEEEEEVRSGDQESPAEGNEFDVGYEVDGEPIEVGYEIGKEERLELGGGDGLDVLSQQSSKEESPGGDDLYEPSHWCGVSKKRKKSERILKRKLSKPVYDEDGGGSAIDKPLNLD